VKGKKKETTDKASAFDLSRPSDFMVFISNLINRNPTSTNYFPYLDGLSILVCHRFHCCQALANRIFALWEQGISQTLRLRL